MYNLHESHIILCFFSRRYIYNIMQNLRAVLDLWNGYVKGVLFAQEEWQTIIVAKEMIKTVWMRKGKFLDVEEFEAGLVELLNEFNKKLWGNFLDEIVIWVSHPDMLFTRIREFKRVMSASITVDDVAHLSKVLADISTQPNYETLKIIPVEWIIDDHTRLKDPVGMQGSKLEVVADIFAVPRNFYQHILDLINKLDLNVIDIVPNILGWSELSVDFDSKDLGTLFIDIGANQTSFAVYEEWIPLWYQVIPLGGENVTKDISIWLQIDIKEAELIKREKGIVLWDEKIESDESIDLPFLSDIISARYEEIFNTINEYLIQAGKDGKLAGGVVLTWWWAKMRRLDQLAKHIFKLAVFYGRDKVMGNTELSQNIQFINVLWDYVRSVKYEEWQGGWWAVRLGKRMNMWWDMLSRVRRRIKDMI